MTIDQVNCPHLKSLCTRYGSWAVEEQRKLFNGNGAKADEVTDKRGVEVALGQKDSLEDRLKIIAKWLENYGVLQGPNLRENRGAVSKAVIAFFNEPLKTFNASRLIEWHKHITDEYKALNTELRNHAYTAVTVSGRSEKDLKERSFLSLTSKALWCKYPKFTPIYDKNAITALRLLTRLRQKGSYASAVDQNDNGNKLKRPRGLSKAPTASNLLEYTIFVKNYLPIYFELKPHLELLAKENSYPYPIRIFDKMLWILGSSSLDIDNRKATYEEFERNRP